MTGHVDWQCPHCDWYSRQFVYTDAGRTMRPASMHAAELVSHAKAVHDRPQSITGGSRSDMERGQ